MKTRMLVSILILILAVLIIAGSCATNRKAISKVELIGLSGIWVYTDSTDTPEFGKKWIISDDYTYTTYRLVDDEKNFCRGKLTILETWADSEGIIWFKATYKCDVHGRYGPIFGRISDSKKVWDFLYTVGTVTIEEWDLENKLFSHLTYYRQ